MDYMDINQIQKYLPQRYPFLMIDRVIELHVGKSLVAIKNVSANEHFFVGHFPQQPIMPGVLIIECLAQACGVLALKTGEATGLKTTGTYFFAGIDNTRFKRPVVPGDQLRLEVELIKMKSDIWKFTGHASVDGQLACSTEITSARRDYHVIHPTAIIDPQAKLAENVTVGPWTYIGPHVQISDGTVIASHVVIKGPTVIGCDNQIFQFTSIGDNPQDKKYEGELTRLEIGERNIIREGCTINRGTFVGGKVTRIGDDNLFMAYTHIAHDCFVANHTVFANNASLAGHVVVEDFAILSAFSGVHQFCRIGAHSFAAASSIITKDVPPFVKVSGYFAEPFGLNLTGLKRRGFSEETLVNLRRAYKIIYRQSLTVSEAAVQLHQLANECPEVKQFLNFVRESERGIVR